MRTDLVRGAEVAADDYRMALLLIAGLHVKIVPEMLGYNSVEITPDRYSHVIPNMQRQAATALEAALANAGADLVRKSVG